MPSIRGKKLDGTCEYAGSAAMALNISVLCMCAPHLNGAVTFQILLSCLQNVNLHSGSDANVDHNWMPFIKLHKCLQRLAQEDAWSHMPELVWIGLPDASSLPQDQDQQLQIPPRSSSSNGGSGATGTQHSALKTSWQETPPLSHVNGSDSTTTQHPASPPKQSISPSLSSAQARPSLQPPSFASNFSVRMGLKVPLLQKSLSGSRAAAAAAAAAPPPPPPGCMPVHYFAV